VSAAVFTVEDAHRRCRATRNDALLAAAWVEWATREWERSGSRVEAIKAANAQVSGTVRRHRRPRRYPLRDPFGSSIGK
jgi:hypothetical protein